MGDVKQFAVRSRVSPEGPRLERELFCRKRLTHSLQCIERFGADSCLLHALRSSSRDDSEEKTGETTHKHQRQASSQGSLNEHVSLPSTNHLFLAKPWYGTTKGQKPGMSPYTGGSIEYD